MAEPHGERESIEVPRGTVWPMLAALSFALLWAGIVTDVTVTALGLVLGVVSVVGWFRDVLPFPAEERVPLRPAAERAQPVQPRPEAVEHLRAGHAGHRMRIPVAIHPYTAGVRAGLVGGACMAALAGAYGLLAHGSPFYAGNLLAGVVLPSMAEAGAEQSFSSIALFVALIVHTLLSVLVGLVYAFVLPMLPGRHALWGGLVAPLVWTGLLWPFMDVVNPALAEHVDWAVFVATQVAFGLVVSWSVARTERVDVLQSWSLAARAGVEATGTGEDES